MSLNTKDIRDYLLETNAIEEAEAILLQSFLNKEDNVKKPRSNKSEPIVESTKAGNKDSFDAVKLADLLQSYEKKDISSKDSVKSRPTSILDKDAFDKLGGEDIEKLAQEEIWKLEQQKINIQRKLEDQKMWSEQQEKLKGAGNKSQITPIMNNKYLDIDTTYELQNKLQSISKNHVLKTAQYQANILQAQQDLQSLTTQAHAIDHSTYSAPLTDELSSFVKKYLGNDVNRTNNPTTNVAMNVDEGTGKSSVSDDLYRKSRLENILSNISHDSYLQEKQAHIQQLRNIESEKQRYDSMVVTHPAEKSGSGQKKKQYDLDHLLNRRDIPITKFVDDWLQEDFKNVNISINNEKQMSTVPTSRSEITMTNRPISILKDEHRRQEEQQTSISAPTDSSLTPSSSKNTLTTESIPQDEMTSNGYKNNKRFAYYTSNDDMLNNNSNNNNNSSPIKRNLTNSLVDNIAARGGVSIQPQSAVNAPIGLDQFRHLQPSMQPFPSHSTYNVPPSFFPYQYPGAMMHPTTNGLLTPGYGGMISNVIPPINSLDPLQQTLYMENLHLKQQLQFQQPQQNVNNGYIPSFAGNNSFEQARAAALQQALQPNTSNPGPNSGIDVTNNPRNSQDAVTPRVPPLNGNNNNNSNNNNNIPTIKSLKFQQEEAKKQEEIRMLELELVKLRQQKELNDFQQQVDQESSYKIKEKEYELWIQESKYQLQKVKMQQVLLKEQKLLTLQEQEYEQLKNGGTGLSGGVAPSTNTNTGNNENSANTTVYRLREECGVKNQFLPVDVLSKGLSLIVDGVYIPLKHRENALMITGSDGDVKTDNVKDAIYRIAIGIYDDSGKSVMKLKASEWFPFFSAASISEGATENNSNTASSLDILSKFTKTAVFQDLSVNELLLQTKDAYSNGGYKVLFEIQFKESEQGVQKSFGWAILPLTVYTLPNQPQVVLLPERVNSITSDDSYAYCIANNTWRIPIRKGISDPHCNPFTATIDVLEEQHKDAFLLLRCVDGNDFIFAKRWSLSAPNVMSQLANEKEILKFYDDLLSRTKINRNNELILAESNESVPPSRSQQQAVPPLSRQQSIQNALQPPSSRGMTPNKSVKVGSTPGLSRGASSRGNILNNSNSTASLGMRNMDTVPEEGEDLSPPTPKPSLSEEKQPSLELATQPVIPPRNTQQHFIPGPLLGPCDSKYQRGDGIDLYLDSARFLPDNVTITRISIRFFNANKEQIGTTYECLGKLTSSKLSPVFNFKIELRNPNGNYPATMIGLIRLDTIDSSTMLSGGIGYTCFKLFSTRDRQYISSDSNTSASSTIYLNTGCFQYPIYFGKFPAKISQFSETMLSSNGMQSLPLATVLLRVCTAPKAKDGLTCISKNEYPPNEWEKLGLNISMPKYTDGVYINQGYPEPTPQELLLYEKKVQLWSNITMEESFLQALNSSNTRMEMFPKRPKPTNNKPSSAAPKPSNPGGAPDTSRNTSRNSSTTSMSPEEEKWWSTLLPSIDQMKRSIDYTLALPYHPEIGCYVTILGIHHLPDDTTNSTSSLTSGLGLFGGGANAANNASLPSSFTMHKVVATVCPPGIYYRNPTLFSPSSSTSANGGNSNFTPTHLRDHTNTLYVTKSYDLEQCIVQKDYRFVEEDALFIPLEMSKQLYLLCEVRSLLVELNPGTSSNSSANKKGISTKAGADGTAASTVKTSISVTGNDGNALNISLDLTTYSKKTYWTLLPLSCELFPGHGNYYYLSSGVFQLPLIEGTLPFQDLFVDSLTNNMTTKNPMNELVNRLTSSSNTAAWKLIDGASVTIQISHPTLKSTQAGSILTSAIEQNTIDTRYLKHFVNKAQDGYYGNTLPNMDAFSLSPTNTNKPPPANTKSTTNSTANSSKRTLSQVFAKVQDTSSAMKMIHEKFCNQLGV